MRLLSRGHDLQKRGERQRGLYREAATREGFDALRQAYLMSQCTTETLPHPHTHKLLHVSLERIICSVQEAKQFMFPAVPACLEKIQEDT